MRAGIPRGARRAAPLAGVLIALAGLSGCSGAHPATTAAARSAAPVASTDSRAAAALARAASTLAVERSFRFDATQTVAARSSSSPTTSRVVGSVVRGQGVAYTLTVGRTSTQVVRIRRATFVRTVPGRWAKLAKPRPVTDPTGSLAAVLHGLAGTARASTSGGSTTTVVGTLSTSAAKAAGIPTGTEPAQVTADIDGAGHVTRVTVHTVTQTGTQTGTTPVAVTLVTSYTAFDRVPALRAPR